MASMLRRLLMALNSGRLASALQPATSFFMPANACNSHAAEASPGSGVEASPLTGWVCCSLFAFSCAGCRAELGHSSCPRMQSRLLPISNSAAVAASAAQAGPGTHR